MKLLKLLNIAGVKKPREKSKYHMAYHPGMMASRTYRAVMDLQCALEELVALQKNEGWSNTQIVDMYADIVKAKRSFYVANTTQANTHLQAFSTVLPD